MKKTFFKKLLFGLYFCKRDECRALGINTSFNLYDDDLIGDYVWIFDFTFELWLRDLSFEVCWEKGDDDESDTF